jgi:hypothetical protein
MISKSNFYLSPGNNRYYNQVMAMILETDTRFEQNSFDQEHFSLCLESEDTVKYRKITISFFFSSCIVDCVPQLKQDFLLDHKLNIV